MVLGTDSVYRFLHLAVTTVASFHGIGRRRQQRVVEIGQGFVQVGRLKLPQDRAHRLETTNPLTQAGQLGQGRIGAAATIKQTIDLVHDLPQDTQMRQATRDLQQRLAFGWRQVTADEQVAAIEQAADFVLKAFAFLGQSFRCFAGPTLGQLGLLSRDLLAFLGQRMQDRLGQFRDGVELAHLMRDLAENLRDRHGIQGRRIGRDATQCEAALLQHGLEFSEESTDVVVVGSVIQDLIAETFEIAVIDDRQDAEWSVVQFVGGDVAGEVGEGPIKISVFDLPSRFFFPLPPPSFGW